MQVPTGLLRTIAIDEALAARAHLKVGDTVAVSSRPGTATPSRETESNVPAPEGETVLATHEAPGLPPHSARIVEK